MPGDDRSAVEYILPDIGRMSVSRIEDLQAFVAVVEQGSLTGAARHLRRSLQSISRSLAGLEHSVGHELVRRTTRRSSPTDAGIAFHRRLSAALAEIQAAQAQISNQRIEPSGRLRISATAAFGTMYLVPAITAFLDAHQKIDVELDLTDRWVDLIDEGVDMAVRLGELPDSTLKARRLGALRRVVFASPGYLSTHGRPRRPDDLLKHECIVHTRQGDLWPFRVGSGIRVTKVSGRFRTSGMWAVNEAAVGGLGIAISPLYAVRELVNQRKLEVILKRFEPPPLPVHAVWPATIVVAPKTRLFVEFLVEQLKAEAKR
jgi:DNA-binding transcriptional LysR family regulator